jgi:hypothetical protein
MQVRAYVRIVVNADAETLGHGAKRLAHGAIMPAERPRAVRPATRQNEVHRPPRADGALELAMPTTRLAAVLKSTLLAAHPFAEKR